MENVCGVERHRSRQRRSATPSAAKAALSILPACFINPGDVALMTTPGLSRLRHARQVLRRRGLQPAAAGEERFPARTSTPSRPTCSKRAKVLVINYPNNPTGASAPRRSSSPKAVAFAKKHNLIVIHDAAYAALVFEGKPLSFLATPGAKDVGVELHSMSKGFNMTGWRLGFVAGNALIVKAYGDVKDNTDSGQFLAIQKACAVSLDHPEITQKIAAKYSPADGRAGGGAQQVRLQRHEAERLVLPLRPRARRPPSAKTASASTFDSAEDSQPVADHRETDQHRALGRCRGVPAVQRHVHRQGREGRRGA